VIITKSVNSDVCTNQALPNEKKFQLNLASYVLKFDQPSAYFFHNLVSKRQKQFFQFCAKEENAF
jgi:hypothetical protein